MLSRFFIKISSYFKLLIDNAIAIDIAVARPSGIATINKATETIANLPNCKRVSFENKSRFEEKIAKSIIKIIYVRKQIAVIAVAYFDIYFATLSSFSSKYVCYSSKINSPCLRFLTLNVLSPTATTKALP
jgi:hypothetical protein